MVNRDMVIWEANGNFVIIANQQLAALLQHFSTNFLSNCKEFGPKMMLFQIAMVSQPHDHV